MHEETEGSGGIGQERRSGEVCSQDSGGSKEWQEGRTPKVHKNPYHLSYLARLKADPKLWADYLQRNRENQAKYRKKHYQKVVEGNARYRAKYSEEYRIMAAAYRAVRIAKRSGLLVRPDTCSKCQSVGIIEGHHEDYSKPLEVTWLCKPCHREANFARARRERTSA